MEAVEQRLLELVARRSISRFAMGTTPARAFYEAIGYVRDPVVSYGKRLISDR